MRSRRNRLINTASRRLSDVVAIPIPKRASVRVAGRGGGVMRESHTVRGVKVAARRGWLRAHTRWQGACDEVRVDLLQR